jgi:hypothetical protein
MRSFFLAVGVIGSAVLVTMALATLVIQYAGYVELF